LTACTWICKCKAEARYRVWFQGCEPGCGGHLMCYAHGSGKFGGVIRCDKLPEATP
jgi:hypothetical protein